MTGHANVRSNLSLHLTFASRLRGLAPAGELKRWASEKAMPHSASFSSSLPPFRNRLKIATQSWCFDTVTYRWEVEIDSDGDNSHRPPLFDSELMSLATPSWHSLPHAASPRAPRDGEVPFIR